MKPIRLIRVVLALLLLMLVAIVIIQFERPEPEGMDTTSEDRLATGEDDASARVSGGEQVFFRNGEPVARLTFERAVTDDESGTLVENVKLVLEQRQLTIHASRARILDPLVDLLGDVRLESATGNNLTLAAPVRYDAPLLTGSGRAEIRSGNVQLDGTGFTIHTEQEWIRLGSQVHLFIPEADLEMEAHTGLYRFPEDCLLLVNTLRFQQRSHDRQGASIRGKADMSLIEPGNGIIRLYGRGKARWGGGQLYFTRLRITSDSGQLRLDSRAPALLSTHPDSWLAYLPRFQGTEEQISGPWSIIQFADGSFSMADFLITPGTGLVTGVNPYGAVNGRRIRGQDVTITDARISISQPVLDTPDQNRISGRTLIRNTDGTIYLNGPINGSGPRGVMLAESGWFRNPDWYFQNSVWWSDKMESRLSGRELILKNGSFTHARISGGVETVFAPETGASPVRILSGMAEMHPDMLRVREDVVATQDDVTIRADRGYLTAEQGVFLPSSVTIGTDLRADGNVLILPVHSTWGWLYGTVHLKDARGNRANGHKLTFERTTGRISMYKGKNNVQISLTL